MYFFAKKKTEKIHLVVYTEGEGFVERRQGTVPCLLLK